MIETIAYFILFVSIVLIVALSILYIYQNYKYSALLSAIFAQEDDIIIGEKFTKRKAAFKLKLQRAGLKRKQFNEIVAASILAALALIALLFIIDFSFIMKSFILFMAIGIAVFMPYLYLEEQIKARIKRIDNDLPIFIDLLIIILEGGVDSIML